MLFDEFLESTKSKTTTTIKSFSNQVNSIIIEEEGDLNKPTYDVLTSFFSKEENIDKIFETHSLKTKMSISAFARQKNLILAFMNWLQKNELCNVDENVYNYAANYEFSKVIQQDLLLLFFKNLNDVLDYIDLVGETQFKKARKKNPKIKIYDKKTDLLTIKSICILSWYGFEAKEMVTLDKNSFQNINNQFFIVCGDKNIQIRKNEFDILVSLLEATGEYVLCSPIVFSKFYGNGLLFKPRHQDSVYEWKSISKVMKAFNDVVVKIKAPKLLSSSALKTNKILIDAMVYSNLTYRGIRNYFHGLYVSATAQTYIHLLTGWLKLYHRIEIKK